MLFCRLKGFGAKGAGSCEWLAGGCECVQVFCFHGKQLCRARLASVLPKINKNEHGRLLAKGASGIPLKKPRDRHKNNALRAGEWRKAKNFGHLQKPFCSDVGCVFVMLFRTPTPTYLHQQPSKCYKLQTTPSVYT